jgi:hypothetical protein
VPQLSGQTKRKQIFVRLGSVSEHPNRTVAVELLRQKVNAKPCSQTTFSELVLGWRKHRSNHRGIDCELLQQNARRPRYPVLRKNRDIADKIL